MCRDQNLVSETSERTDGRTDERMKIEKPVVGWPLLGPAIIKRKQLKRSKLNFKFQKSQQIQRI